MKRHKYIILLASISICFFSTGFIPGASLRYENKISISDTASFVPNTAGGWDVYSSYLHQDTQDSVDFELIMKHDFSIDWTNEKWIGTINDANFIPKKQQIITYYLLPGNTWKIHIKKDGTVFFQTIHGSVPPGNLFIIPIKIRYKNN